MKDISGGLAEAWEALAGVKPAGEPDKPLLEAALVFAAFYLVGFAPADATAAGASLGTAPYQGLILLHTLPKAFLILYMMARAEGLAAFGLRPLRAADLYRGALTALGAMGVIALPALLASSLGWSNPLLASAGAGGASLALLPLVLASSIAVGYGEELFFRAYLMRRLGQGGLSPFWAAAVSTAVFASAHGLQGWVGIAGAAALGAWFAFRWHRGGNLHEVALGHALYDAAVMAAAIWASA